MHKKIFLQTAAAITLLLVNLMGGHAHASTFAVYESWLGSEIGEFIEKSRPPQNVSPNGRGGSIYTFIDEDRYTNGYGHLVDVRKNYLYFYVNNKNRIYAWKYIKSDGSNVCDDPSGLCSTRTRERIQEHRSRLQTTLSTWIGDPMADRLKMYKQSSSHDEEAVYQKDSVGGSVFTLKFPDDSGSYPGGGYASLHADTYGVIYGWSGVVDGKQLCVNPDIDNICMSAAGASPGPSQRGRVGLVYDDVSSERAAAVGLPKPMGVLIIRVEAGNLGERSGLKVGDIVTKVNGVVVDNLRAMPSFSKASLGTRYVLTVWRNRASQEVSFTLGN